MKQSTTRGVTARFLALIASFTMILAGIAGVALAGPAAAADPVGQGECPSGYSQMYAENVSGQSIAWNPNADAAAVHSGGGVDETAFKTFIKPEPITAWKLNKPGTAYLGLSNVVWCSKDSAPTPVKCWDGSDAPGNDVKNCPPTPKCWDGSAAPGNDVKNCPATPKCTDGTDAPGNDVSKCPVTPPGGSQTPTGSQASGSNTAQVTSAAAPQAGTAPVSVSAPAAATTKAPAKVTVPQAATLPAAVPAGDGSQAPGLPVWIMALAFVGMAGAGLMALRLAVSSK